MRSDHLSLLIGLCLFPWFAVGETTPSGAPLNWTYLAPLAPWDVEEDLPLVQPNGLDRPVLREFRVQRLRAGVEWVPPRIQFSREEAFDEERTAVRLANEGVDQHLAARQEPLPWVGDSALEPFLQVPLSIDTGIRVNF